MERGFHGEYDPPPAYEPNNKCLEWIKRIDLNRFLAFAFIVINFLWWIRNFSASLQTDSVFFQYFELICNGLGFLLIRKEDIESSNIFASLTILQLYLPCSLCWGITVKNPRRLEQWLILTVAISFLYALYGLHSVFYYPSPLFFQSNSLTPFLIVIVGYYAFNAFYIWRIYELRCQLLASSPDAAALVSSNVCLCSNTACFIFTVAVHLVIYFFWIVYMTVWQHSWDTYLEIVLESRTGTFYLITGCLGFIMGVTVLHYNRKGNTRGIQYWMLFQLFVGLLFFETMAAAIMKVDNYSVYYHREQMLTSILTTFLLYELPIIFTLWIAYIRLQEITYAPRVFSVGGNSMYIAAGQTVTININ